MLFNLLQKVMEGFIFVIGHPRETVGIIDLEVVPAGVCRVTVTTNQESYIEGGVFSVEYTICVGDTGIIYITFILEAGGFLDGEGPRGFNHGHSFVGL